MAEHLDYVIGGGLGAMLGVFLSDGKYLQALAVLLMIVGYAGVRIAWGYVWYALYEDPIGRR